MGGKANIGVYAQWWNCRKGESSVAMAGDEAVEREKVKGAGPTWLIKASSHWAIKVLDGLAH